jgi:putative endonuclease
MPFYVYILYSNKINKYYTGYREDISTRLTKHNQHSTPSTKSGIPWVLVKFEFYWNRYLDAEIKKKFKK